MIKSPAPFVFLVFLCFYSLAGQTQANPGENAGATENALESKKAPSIKRNGVLMIGDGMDDHQITIARNYLAGTRGRLTPDNMTIVAQYKY